MQTNEELYEGFSREQAEAYRSEAIAKYGADEVEAGEANLRWRGKTGFEQLKADQRDITQHLLTMMDQDPASAPVQQQIARHWANIRGFWGESVCQGKNRQEAYKGLAQLYLDDPRFTSQNGQPNPAYAAF